MRTTRAGGEAGQIRPGQGDGGSEREADFIYCIDRSSTERAVHPIRSWTSTRNLSCGTRADAGLGFIRILMAVYGNPVAMEQLRVSPGGPCLHIESIYLPMNPGQSEQVAALQVGNDQLNPNATKRTSVFRGPTMP